MRKGIRREIKGREGKGVRDTELHSLSIKSTSPSIGVGFIEALSLISVVPAIVEPSHGNCAMSS